MSWWPRSSPRGIEPVSLRFDAPTVSRDETARRLPLVWSCDLPPAKARVIRQPVKDEPTTFARLGTVEAGMPE